MKLYELKPFLVYINIFISIVLKIKMGKKLGH